MDKPLTVVILAHGIFGWGNATSDQQMKDYYRGVQPFLLEEYGQKVDLRLYAPTVPPSDSVAGRGERLQEQINAAWDHYPKGTRVHIIAHSMGGLDSRWVLVQPGMADKIASLTTIATPHRGTTLGDLARDELPLIMPAAGLLGKLWDFRRWIWRRLPFTRMASDDALALYHKLLDHLTTTDREKVEKGLDALTLNGAAAFNEEHEQAEALIRKRTTKPVAYFAYGGVVKPDQTLPLKVTHDIVALLGTQAERRGGNDGAVSVWSAHFPWDAEGNHYRGTLPFDHFMQINWKIPDARPGEAPMPRTLKPLYREIMDNIVHVQLAQC